MDASGKVRIEKPTATVDFKMYYSLQLYFANGGGPCYIVSVGDYSGSVELGSASSNLHGGLEKIENEDEPTLILFPDATSLSSSSDMYSLYNLALMQCEKLQDRFVIIDTYTDDLDVESDPSHTAGIRFNISSNSDNKYGAAYFPHLDTILNYRTDGAKILLTQDVLVETTLADLKVSDIALYNSIKHEIGLLPITLPPSAAIAGVYARIDNLRGVWKAPANVSLNFVRKPSTQISHDEQELLNIDVVTGKSINAIRSFTGKGILVWGARTLAGNDNEWRYVPVRRFFIFVEESVKKATAKFVFEPNDINTWVKVKAMITNFLNNKWRAGALAGATPEQAFYVKIGLNETMTAADVLEGKMIIEIGMAVVRPAEFILLKFSHKMQEA